MDEEGGRLCFAGGRDGSPASVVEEDVAWWTEEAAGRTIVSAPGAIASIVSLCNRVLFFSAAPPVIFFGRWSGASRKGSKS